MNDTRSIEDRLKNDESFAAYEGFKFEAILNLSLEGKRIGDLPADLALFARFPPNSAQQKLDETIALANVLRAVGFTEANLQLRERPDFLVQTPKQTLLVEVAEVLPGCQRDSVNLIQRAVSDALVSDMTLSSKLGNLVILLTIQHTATAVGPLEALSADCPGDHVSKSDARAMGEEILGLVSIGYFGGIPRNTKTPIPESAAKKLAKYHATAYVGSAVNGQPPGVTIFSTRFTPRQTSLYYAVVEQLNEKREQVKTYQDRTDWLVLCAVEKGGRFEYDLNGKSFDIEPFKAVFLIIWRSWTPYVAAWRAADGAVKPTIPSLPDERAESGEDRSFHEWAKSVDATLLKLARSNKHARLKLFLSPVSAQWYQQWLGPYRWATCERRRGQPGKVRLLLWTNGAWEGRQDSTHEMKDVDLIASLIWGYLA